LYKNLAEKRERLGDMEVTESTLKRKSEYTAVLSQMAAVDEGLIALN